MMNKIYLIITLLVSFLFLGCSDSSINNYEIVTKKACKAFYIKDYNSLINYVSPQNVKVIDLLNISNNLSDSNKKKLLSSYDKRKCVISNIKIIDDTSLTLSIGTKLNDIMVSTFNGVWKVHFPPLLLAFDSLNIYNNEQISKHKKTKLIRKPLKRLKAIKEDFVGELMEIGSFKVSLLNTNKYILRISMSLEVNDKNSKKNIIDKLNNIRDISIKICSNNSLEDISSKRGKNRLREELLYAINAIYKNRQVMNVYFTEFHVSDK